MKITARLNHFRTSPRKVRLVADLIRGMKVTEAEAQLKYLTKRAADPVLKLLNSATANASHDFNLEKDDLYVSDVQVNEGPALKRWRARAMGRADLITKRTSHIYLTLKPKKGVKAKKKKEPKPETVKLKDMDEIKKSEPQKKLEPKSESATDQAKHGKPASSAKPHSASSKSKKKFWSRQTFGNVKKMFKRKSF